MGVIRTRQGPPRSRSHLRRNHGPYPSSEEHALVLVPRRDAVPCSGTADQRSDRAGVAYGNPVGTQWQRREEVERIRREARAFAERHLDDPFFVAGVVLYWGEGAKTHADLALANADPRALRFSIAWVRAFHDPYADFVLKINLHTDNDEPRAREFWRDATGLASPEFYRTFIKPEGTGHRKNHLAHGVCQVRVRQCTDHWVRTMEWIDTVATSTKLLGPSERYSP